MKHKKESLMLIMFLAMAFCFAIPGVFATLVNPANSATLTGTAVLNATNTTLPNMLNCSFYAFSPSTANSTWSYLGNFVNASANALNINDTFNSAILEDANNYMFNATCYNSTASTSSVGTASVIIQNTVPTAPVLTSHTNNEVLRTAGAQTFTFTVVDANTTSCSCSIARGGASSGSQDYYALAGTYSGSSCSCSKTFSTSADNGNWYLIGTASDETDTTSSGATIISVQMPGSGSAPIDEGSAPMGNMPTGDMGGVQGNYAWVFWLVIAIIVIVAIFVIYFLTRK